MPRNMLAAVNHFLLAQAAVRAEPSSKPVFKQTPRSHQHKYDAHAIGHKTSLQYTYMKYVQLKRFKWTYIIQINFSLWSEASPSFSTENSVHPNANIFISL